jgi:lipid A 3-O-deacylase
MRAFRIALVLSPLLGAGAALAGDFPAQPSAELFDPRPIADSPRFIDEMRAGASLFVDERPEVREDGVFLSGEILFATPFPAFRNRFADALLTPRPHVGALVSTDGGTSLAYAGLTWDFPLTERLFLEASFGGAIHDGETERRPVQTGPELGCPVSFRESIGIGLNLNDNWRVLASVDHASHAGLCGVNDGLTHAGVSVGYRF